MLAQRSRPSGGTAPPSHSRSIEAALALISLRTEVHARRALDRRLVALQQRMGGREEQGTTA